MCGFVGYVNQTDVQDDVIEKIINFAKENASYSFNASHKH